jgi:hypothetical protein
VEEVKEQREVPDIKPGYIVQLKVVCKFVFEYVFVLVLCVAFVHKNDNIFCLLLCLIS